MFYFSGSRDYPRTSVMDSENRPYGDMYRDHRPGNNSFMTMPPLSVPPPIISRQPVVSEPQMPSRVAPPSQAQAHQSSPSQTVTSDSERVMSCC